MGITVSCHWPLNFCLWLLHLTVFISIIRIKKDIRNGLCRCELHITMINSSRYSLTYNWVFSIFSFSIFSKREKCLFRFEVTCLNKRIELASSQESHQRRKFLQAHYVHALESRRFMLSSHSSVPFKSCFKDLIRFPQSKLSWVTSYFV